MKIKMSFLVLFVLIAFAALVSTGCITTQTTQTKGENQGNFGEHIRTPVKDFQSLGLIFTETRLGAIGGGSDEGQIFTYQALLKEAQTLGADAIINVVIDKKTRVTAVSDSPIITWYGSALAIKYTSTLTETKSVTVSADGGTATTTVTTSVYFNDGGAAAAKPPVAEQVSATPAPVPAKGIRQ
ncbi:hypothetical protein AGMMS49928_10240 [Spirochaetia bacterium]|nr:hypothetical protein AGMMS49928_10240 [Spirochaetia bacterium]